MLGIVTARWNRFVRKASGVSGMTRSGFRTERGVGSDGPTALQGWARRLSVEPLRPFEVSCPKTRRKTEACRNQACYYLDFAIVSDLMEMTAILKLAPLIANVREHWGGVATVDSVRHPPHGHGFGARDMPGPGRGE
jgi:hypothetical protein